LYDDIMSWKAFLKYKIKVKHMNVPYIIVIVGLGPMGGGWRWGVFIMLSCHTCQTPTIALAMRMSRMTNGSTKAVIWSSDSSNQASTYTQKI